MAIPMRPSLLLLPAAALALIPLLSSRAEKSAPASAPVKAVADMTAAARNFLASLTAEQKALTVFKMEDPERQNWRFVPIERKGITLEALQPHQDHLATRCSIPS